MKIHMSLLQFSVTYTSGQQKFEFSMLPLYRNELWRYSLLKAMLLVTGVLGPNAKSVTDHQTYCIPFIVLVFSYVTGDLLGPLRHQGSVASSMNNSIIWLWIEHTTIFRVIHILH